MLKINYYITLNNLRSFFGRDLFIYFLGLLGVMFLITKGLYDQAEKYPEWFLVFAFEILRIHQKRKDLSLIKNKYFSILFFEYTLYSIPVLILYVLSSQWIYFLGFLFLIITIIFLPKFRIKAIQYPFVFFLPFWTIAFRKNRLYVLYPISIFLNIKGFTVGNIGLVYLSLLLIFLGIFNVLSKSELKHHISISVHRGEHYLSKQLRNTLINCVIAFSPLAIFILYFDAVQIWLLIPILIVLLEINLIKYAFFDDLIIQTLAYMLCLVSIQHLIPLIAFPYLYYLSIKKINLIQDVKTAH